MSVSGFALRNNGTCPGKHVDCGTTVSPYHACCPESAFCPSAYNVDCCPTAKNCTTTLLRDPQCADRSWDLYDNSGYFCCKKNFVGYASRTDSDGCAAPGYTFKNGERLLPIISSGTVSSASATASSTSTSNPTPTPTPTDSSNEKEGGSGKGPVIGGVVGGVVVLVLAVVSLVWLWRRSKRRGTGQELDSAGLGMQQSGAQGAAMYGKENGNGHSGGLAEMEGGGAPAQLPAQVPAQLPERNEYNELPA